MISLVKNELIKIFHKKGIYIYGIIITLILAFTLVVEKTSMFKGSFDYYEMVEENLKNYDLTDSDELEWYVDEKSTVETHKIAKDYDYSSPEYYYVETEIANSISMMNRYKYIEKNDDLFNEYQEEYNNQMKNLENYNWRLGVEAEKRELEFELEELKAMEINDDVKSRIDEIGYMLEGIRYRLENDVAPSYSVNSSMVEDYIRNAMAYNTMDKDENHYTSNSDLMSKRYTEKEYYLSKYKIENDIVKDDETTFQEDYVGDISSSVMIFVIAMVIIAGGIFAEEFNKGTIKQLLVKPFTRMQIYISKIIAVFIAVIVFMLFYCTVTFVYYWILDGNISTLFNPIIDYSFKTNAIVEYNTFSYMFTNLAATLPELIILTLVCLFVGIVSTSTVGAVISVFGLEFANELISVFLPEKILSFIPMNCWNFSSYLEYGLPMYNYGSFASSLIICILTAVILFVLGLIIFKKKDIKNQ